MRPLDFVLRWIEATGGLAEPDGPDVHQVALPSPLPGFPGLSALTGEIEAARETPGAELVAPGSALLDAVSREVRGSGRAARVFLVGLDPDHAGDPARAFRFGEAEVAVLRSRAYEHRLAVFTFHLLFESDERDEDLVAVGVDANHGRIARRSAELALTAPFSEERLESWPLAPLLPLDGAYALAREELHHRLAPLLTSRRTELGRHLRVEADRTARYYDDLCAETSAARTDRTPEEVASRLSAIRIEKERRLSELEEKFALRVNASLATLLVAVQPKVHLALRVGLTKSPPATLEVVWDPLLREFEAPDCPVCGRPGFEFEVAAGQGRLRCPLCPPDPKRRR